MAYIVREDGVHFVVPSYRQVLTVKQKSQLKKEINILSQNYGNNITLQKRGTSYYEVAFSSDSGYLLGESIWHSFKKPLDFIYCEAQANGTEAILIIVKAGIVYLDGIFPLDSIPEELIIFLSQQNNFDIYIYGNVPISEKPEVGKFSFDEKSVRLFTVLTQPAFPTVPTLKIYQLQAVDVVLKSQGIGVFPLIPLMSILGCGVLAFLIWEFWETFMAAPPPVVHEVKQNPYQAYYDALRSPSPQAILAEIMYSINIFATLPGWKITQLKYSAGNVVATTLSIGGTMAELMRWGTLNHVNVNIEKQTITLSRMIMVKNRTDIPALNPVNYTIAALIDKIVRVYPGNNFELGDAKSQGANKVMPITVKYNGISQAMFSLISEQLIGLAVTLKTVTIQIGSDMSLTGDIVLDALGN